MKWRAEALVGAAFAVLFLVLMTVFARAESSVSYDLMSPLAAYTELCQVKPDACALTSHKQVFVGKARIRQLEEINSRVNRSIIPVKDADHWGVADRWTWPAEDGLGDCEEFVLEKRHQLRELGWPASALVIAVVLNRDGEGHAVLVVRTTRGDLVLDNLTHEIKAPRDTGYTFIKRPVPGDPLRWMSWTYL